MKTESVRVSSLSMIAVRKLAGLGKRTNRAQLEILISLGCNLLADQEMAREKHVARAAIAKAEEK